MKEFVAKTLEDALQKACAELQCEKEDLVYSIEEEKKTLFTKRVVINVYELEDVVDYAETYILNITDTLGIEATASTTLKDDMIKITIDSTNNPILIGKNGKTLQAMAELTKLAVAVKFKRRFRLLIDINGYKDSKYRKLVHLAKKTAKQVQRTKTDAVLDPMPADERRIVHNAIHGFKNVKTISQGDGTHRQVHIVFVESENKVSETAADVAEEQTSNQENE